jgi:hypothetical protein
MKYLIIILLLFSSLFAWPAGTTHTMRVIVNSSRVSETATSFVHQLNLSDSIAKIDSLIDSTKNVAVCLPNGSTLKPKDIVYVKGKKFLIYWDGAKHTTTNDTFYLCFGVNLNIVNSTATYSNSNVVHYWGFDKFSSNTFYDYLSVRNGTATSIDTVTASFGAGINFNALADGLNCGYATALSKIDAFTISGVFKVTSTVGNQRLLMIYKNSSEKIYMYFTETVLYLSVGGFYAHISRAGNIENNTVYHFAMVYNSTTLKLYLNGVEKTRTNYSTLPTATSDLSTTNILFGMYAGTESFYGTLDEISVMNVARSSNSILDRYRVLYENSTFYTVGPITNVKKSTGNNKPRISIDIGL